MHWNNIAILLTSQAVMFSFIIFVQFNTAALY